MHDTCVLQPSQQSTGEVPDEFRNQPIEICIASRHLSRLGCAVLSRYTSRLLVKGPAHDHYHLVPTKSFESDHFPNFVEKAWLPPLDMPNSQYIARKTILRAELYAGRTCIHSTQHNLATLVWREHDHSHLDISAGNSYSSLPTMSTLCKEPLSSSATKPELDMRVVRFDRFAHTSCAPLIEARVSVSSFLRTSASRRKLTYSISRLSQRGEWTVVYRSENVGSLCKASKNEFTPAELTHDFLFRGEDQRPLRFALLATGQRGGAQMQYFAIATLDELFRMREESCSTFPPLRTREAVINVGLKLESIDTFQGVTRIFLVFKHARQLRHRARGSTPVSTADRDDNARHFARFSQADLALKPACNCEVKLDGAQAPRRPRRKQSRSSSKAALRHGILRRQDAPGSSLDESGLNLMRLHGWEGADFSID